MSKTGELQIGSVTVPTFPLEDFGDEIYPVVQTNLGFMPFTTPAEATFPSVRVATENYGVLAAHSKPEVGPQVEILLEENFDSGSLSDEWITYVAGDTNRDIAAVVDGKLHVGMKGDALCATPGAYAEYPLGNISGTLDIKFWNAYETPSWWEDTWFRVYQDDEQIFRDRPHDSGYSTRNVEVYTTEVDVDGNIVLRWEISASRYCDISDHAWTRMEVDDILVRLVS